MVCSPRTTCTMTTPSQPDASLATSTASAPPIRYRPAPLVVERDAVTLADIAQPSAGKAAYILGRARRKGTLLRCETWAEREDCRRAARMDGQNAAAMVLLGGGGGGGQYAPMNRFLAARYGPSTTDVVCGRCKNASRAFYTLAKPGEFTYQAEDETWQCHACNHVVATYRAHPHYRLLQCTVRPLGLTRWRPLPRWTRRRGVCRCVPLKTTTAPRLATTTPSPASP